MPTYTSSKAQAGTKTTLTIGGVTVGEIVSIGQSGKQNAIEETTNLQSDGEEFLPTFLQPGKFAVVMNRVAGDTGQIAMKTAFDNKTIDNYVITLGKAPGQTTVGDSFAFKGMVEEFNDLSNVESKKKVACNASIKVSNAIAVTAGS